MQSARKAPVLLLHIILEGPLLFTGMDRSECAQDLDSKESCANTYDNLSQLHHLSQQKMQLKHDCHQAHDSHQACRQQVATEVGKHASSGLHRNRRMQ